MKFGFKNFNEVFHNNEQNNKIFSTSPDVLFNQCHLNNRHACDMFAMY